MPVDFFETAMKVLIIALTAGGGWTALAAIRARIRRMEHGGGEPVQVSELRETVQRLTNDVAELQERVDYAERLLTQQRQPQGRIGD